MKRLKVAASDSLIESIAALGKTVMLAGALALLGSVLGIPINGVNVTTAMSIILMIIGFCGMFISKYYKLILGGSK